MANSKQINVFVRTFVILCAKKDSELDDLWRYPSSDVLSDCSGFLQDDITIANQLCWKLSEIAPGVIRFNSNRLWTFAILT